MTLLAVNRDDKLVTSFLIDTWKTNVCDLEKDEFEKSQKGLRCIKFDGKKSAVSIGHNKTERCHNLTFIREPEPRYLDHIGKSIF